MSYFVNTVLGIALSMALCAGRACIADEVAQRAGVVDAAETQHRMGEDRKQKIVSSLQADISQIEADKAKAARKQKPRLSAELAKKLKFKKAELEVAEAKTAEQYVAEIEAEAEAARRAERAKAIEAARPPLEIMATGINPNAINFPRLTIEVKNTKDLRVEAFEIDVECFDKFGDPVTWPGKGNLYRGIWQDRIEAKQTTRCSWDLHLHKNTAQAKLWIARVKLSDGTVWEQSRADAVRAGQLAPAEKMR